MDAPLLILIDGNALVHRAYRALGPSQGRAGVAFTTKAGEPVTAVYGFASMMLKVMADYKPTHMACTFDTPVPTFRHVANVDYKATRPEMPDDLKPQFGRVKELLEAFGIPIYELDGYEADDVLGTLSRQAAERGMQVIVVTGDADAMQLIGPGVKVLYPPGGKALTDAVLYDDARVIERYGVPPLLLPDWKGLKGDPSDNIKGVVGIGDKGATNLLQAYGSVEGIYEHIDEVKPPRLQQLLRDGRDAAFESKALATIDRAVPVELDEETAHTKAYDRATVVRLLQELEFKSLLARLPQEAKAKPAQPPSAQLSLMDYDGGGGEAGAAGAGADYQVVATAEALDALVARLASAECIAFDAQTSGALPMDTRLVGLALSTGEGAGWYLPIAHQEGPNLPLPQVQARLGPLLADPAKPKAGHNANVDLIVLAEHGLPVEGLVSDTMLAAWLLGERRLGLKEIAFGRLSVEMTDPAALLGTGAKAITMDRVGVPQAAAYAAANADLTGRLRAEMEPELKSEGLWPLYAETEMPLVPVLVQMERHGVALDTEVLAAMSRDLQGRMAGLEGQIYEIVGHHFNINSTQQLGGILFDELGLPKGRKTASGYSTDMRVLENLREAHPIIGLILEYRQLTKLKSTYIDALPALVNPRTGRVHTSFNQTGAATGRVSSNDPNLQNIPVRTELGRQVRTAFVAPPGTSLLSADYSQVELRVLAHLCSDEGLVAAFRADEDIHNATASTVFGVPVAELTKDHRRVAKVVNFGIVYGLSPFGLQRAIPGMSRDEASGFIDTYFGKYPGIKRYIDETLQMGRERGYVETLLGRRRLVPELLSSNAQLRAATERYTINHPVQGSAADVIKVAMIRLHAEMARRNLRSKMILQVHDELLFEVPDAELDEMQHLVPQLMAHSLELAVPLKVEVKAGQNWGQLLEVEDDADAEVFEALTA